MRVQCDGIVNVPSYEKPLLKPENGEELEGWQFAIVLGPVLECTGMDLREKNEKEDAGMDDRRST